MLPETYVTLYPSLWTSSNYDYRTFFGALYAGEKISKETFNFMMTWLGLPTLPEPEPGAPEVEVLGPAAEAPKEPGYLASWGTTVVESLKSFWRWLWAQLKDVFSALWNAFKPTLERAWESIKAAFNSVAQTFLSTVTKFLDAGGVLTPEKALTFATQLYGVALGAGIAAHASSVGLELLHPLKSLGATQISAAISDYAGFGRIANTTIGTLESKILGTAMLYAMNFKYRPRIPPEIVLQTMAVKPDITIEQFRKAMAYNGYRDEWIDAIQRTMYSEPRYFELKMLAEDEAATKEWLFTKIRRAGYIPADAEIFVSSFVKAATRTQRMGFYNQALYMYREGYINAEKFESLLKELELRPDAIYFARRAADLAATYDYTKDAIAYYKNSYLKDIISKSEYLVSLVSLGLTPKRANMLVRLATVQKTPKPTKKVTKEVDASVKQTQTKYVQLYRELYKNGSIDETQYLNYLLALGLSENLAEVTVALEAAKLS
jgi:hypothetical protein